LASGQRTTISNCAINNSGRGIQVATAAQRSSILGNKFEAIASGYSIFLAEGSDIAACDDNDIEEYSSFDNSFIASANRIRIPVGADDIYITGSNDLYEIREDAPSSAYPDRTVKLTTATACVLKDDATGPGGAVVPNLALGSDVSLGAGDHCILKFQSDIDKWVLVSASTAVRKDGLLGTVSQAAGVPTGAVIETGSDTNGRYVRYADGTQLCFDTRLSSAAGSATWTFPVAFVDADIQVLITPGGTLPRFVGVSALFATSASFDAWASDGTTRVAIYVRALAIGRWF
jgi:hypothetical protein